MTTTSPMFALIDGNNFYCSCERLFRPDLKHRPMVVLSNNDGCAIARSNEAKDLGIRMGQPWHEIRHLVQSKGLVAFSANFALYGDISDRMMRLASSLGPRQEIYSIDESFIDVSGILDISARAHDMRENILRGLNIPVCVGIAPTKTLAKLANAVAKSAERKPGSYPSHLARVCNFGEMSEGELNDILAKTDLGEVWGIGPRIAKSMKASGLSTVLDVKRMDPSTARNTWSVVVERTVRELGGIACVDLEDIQEPKKEIASTRSFGKPVTELSELVEAVTEYACRAAIRLRQQNSVAGSLQTFIRTSPFRVKDQQYARSVVVPLRRPTQDSNALVQAAVMGVTAIFRPGFKYAKAGVMLLDLQDDSVEQFELGLDDGAKDRGRLMKAMDLLNERFGRGTVSVASSGIKVGHKAWSMKQERKTPNYTTVWEDMPVVRA